MSSSSSNRHGAERNLNGGLYIRGKAYSILTKLQVADEYKAAAAAGGGKVRPNISKIAKKCQVTVSFVTKIERELLAYNGSVLSPEEIRANAIRQRQSIVDTWGRECRACSGQCCNTYGCTRGVAVAPPQNTCSFLATSITWVEPNWGCMATACSLQSWNHTSWCC